MSGSSYWRGWHRRILSTALAKEEISACNSEGEQYQSGKAIQVFGTDFQFFQKISRNVSMRLYLEIVDWTRLEISVGKV